MKTVIVFILTISLNATALARPVIVRSLGSSESEFESFLHSHNLVSLTESYTQKSEHAQTITEYFEQGLKYHYAGAKTMASQHFQKIVADAYNYDWPANQISMIIHSFLRLAEIYPDKEEQFYIRAIQYQFDFKDLPPFGKVKWEHYKKTVPTRNVDLLPFKSFESIVINGKTYDLEKTNSLILPVAEHRITLLSNVFKIQTFKLYPDQLALMDPPTLPILEGTCERPILNSNESSDVVAFFEKTCVKQKVGGRWVTFGTQQPDLLPAAVEIPTFQTATQQEPFYKKTWFWAAVGVVSGVVIYNALNKKDRSVPTEVVTLD